ncbi:cocaine- and amphetamine-regulated transcript protein-like [Sinocyclocheilus anshuiensis]|uniref:Cocaine- and amphetamine-regulated transcript protein-like n=3 Tax=Cyprininae TaxID=2743694 RepID=A0A673J6B7_9TELE|nr:PREDICTED: cocaine- and amphetamine-regulated transcript protein-like [Sinocyclocheilus anshuiensis]XP_016418030.1 PREDICTED: cocaine- and amphetamine-regulated transcript protein-like [Sinocyclocheilus rhinocerous]
MVLLLLLERSRSPYTSVSNQVLFPATMVSDRIFLLTVTCSVLMLLVSCDDVLEIRSPEDDMKAQEEKELIEALQEVLEKLRNKQIPTAEKKFGWVPSCDAGEQCAVRKGARFGKLCSCPGGTTCSFSILKCL